VPDVAALDASQKVVYDSIFATRGNIGGPFLAWMHSPEHASRAEKLCAFFRYQSSLEFIESELLILCVAHYLNCLEEQKIHEPIACSAGLGMNIIIRIAKHACLI
jgi:4-carboxymuconolactone decarboxylase